MSSSWEVRFEVRLCAEFATPLSQDNTENPSQRVSMPTAQPPASATGNVISHDRWFLDRIATHLLAFEGDSHIEWFEGNYQDYEKDRKKRLGADADQPHRIKYRRIDA
jgi:hypothetical protein